MQNRSNPREQYSYSVENNTKEVYDLINNSSNEDSRMDFVSVAGRLSTIRDLGKIVFADLYDESGTIQVVAEPDNTPNFSDFATNCVGDWIGVTGIAEKTRRGEPSIFIEDWARLARSEEPFPGLKQGLKDPETIYRQRYLDLAVNLDSRDRFMQRSKIVSLVRNVLEEDGFMEVETPVLQPIYGGAAARPFVTHHNTLDMELYMRVAPELYLKRLVIGGFTKVFEIGKVFRNEGISTKHNPEFTMMEAYAAYWDHTNQMRLTEKLFETVALELHGTTSIEYQGREVDLSTPWERKPMDSMVSERLGDEFTVDTALNKLRSVCESFEIEFDNKDRQGKLIQKLYEKLVEDDLWGPIFVTEYPEEISPLARGHRTRPGYTERFEGIVAGKEVCNGFSELNDPRDQYFRFLEQEDSADRDDESMKMDFDYIRALKYGLPPTAGLGIGIDRLVMLMTNAPSIRDVILFPTNRPDGYTTSYENDL